MEHQRLTGSNNDNSGGNCVSHYGSLSLVRDPSALFLKKCIDSLIFLSLSYII